MSDEEISQPTLGNLIVALTEEAALGAYIKPKDLHILVAYLLSDLFGSAPISRFWH